MLLLDVNLVFDSLTDEQGCLNDTAQASRWRIMRHGSQNL